LLKRAAQLLGLGFEHLDFLAVDSKAASAATCPKTRI
jgi:hypothetical protein